jgi:microcystin degradation protein MlrC
MRVFSASLLHETNTFSPMPTGLSAFLGPNVWRPGMPPPEPGMETAVFATCRERADRDGFDFAPGSCFWAMPGGLVARAAYETMRDEILGQLRAAMPVDAVALGLHGAMVADGCEDCEGDLLRRVRGIVGERAVVGALLDPHCHLTAARCAVADAIVLYKEYPHTDFMDRAGELLDIVLAAARGRVRPRMSLYDCRAIGSFPTTEQPMRGLVDDARALEGRDRVLSVSLGHGFPSGDVPESGARVLVVTDDAPDVGARVARDLGARLADVAMSAPRRFVEADEAIDRGLAAAAGTGRPATLADVTDNAGGGAPSDNTDLLRLLIARGVAGASVAPIWDPGAVRLAFEAGAGARLRLRVGGKVCEASGTPVDVDATVLACVEDARQSFAGSPVELGDAVGLRSAEGVGVVLVSRRCQAMGLDLFAGLGIDPTAERLLVVKSNQHFHAAFAPISAEILYVAGRGLMRTDYRDLPWRRVARPIWPLDPPVSGRLVPPQERR